MTFDTLTVLVRQGLDSDLRKNYHSQNTGLLCTNGTRQTDGQTDKQIRQPVFVGQKGKRGKSVREEEKRGPITDHHTLVLHSAVITPGCRSTCQRRSPLSSRSTGPSISINGCANVVQTLELYRTATHKYGASKVGTRKSSISRSSLFFFFFFFTVVHVFRTYFCRGSYAPSSASKPARHFLLGLPSIYWRRDGIIGIRFHHH